MDVFTTITLWHNSSCSPSFSYKICHKTKSIGKKGDCALAQKLVTSFPPWQHGFDSRPGPGRAVGDKVTRWGGGSHQVLQFPLPILISQTASKFTNPPLIWNNIVPILSASINIQAKGWRQGDILNMLSTYRFYAFITNSWSLYQIYGLRLLH
jgi:hypothetical protein